MSVAFKYPDCAVFDFIDQAVIFVNAPRPLSQIAFQSFGLADASERKPVKGCPGKCYNFLA